MAYLLLWHPQVRHDTDAATVYLDLQPSSVDVFEASDAATVYLDLQPGFIYLQVDCVLEVINCTTRWVIEQPIKRRWKIVNNVRRWAILETRRFKWRS